MLSFDFGLKCWKNSSQRVWKGIQEELADCATMWQVTKILVEKCNLPSFGPKDNFHPQNEVTKTLPDVIQQKRQVIHFLPSISKSCMKKYIEDLAKEIALIKTLLPKLENNENKVEQSIASLKTLFEQHYFPQNDFIKKNLKHGNVMLRNIKKKETIELRGLYWPIVRSQKYVLELHLLYIYMKFSWEKH
jgi:hypothetical protein